MTVDPIKGNGLGVIKRILPKRHTELLGRAKFPTPKKLSGPEMGQNGSERIVGQGP